MTGPGLEYFNPVTTVISVHRRHAKGAALRLRLRVATALGAAGRPIDYQ
jgi:hypothetical protein